MQSNQGQVVSEISNCKLTELPKINPIHFSICSFFWAKRIVCLLLAGLLLGSLLISCKQDPTKADAGPAPGAAGSVRAVPVTAATAVRRDMPILVHSNGTAQTCYSVQIQAQVSDMLVKADIVNGQRVAASQPLFTIDPRASRAALELAQANLERDTAQYRNATTEADREEQLRNNKYASDSDYQTALTTAKALAATTRADDAAIRNAQLQVEHCQINSPITGVAGRVLVQPGNLVSAGSTPLVTINQLQPIDVFFSIPARNLDAVRSGLKAGAKMEVQAIVSAASGSKGPPAPSGAMGEPAAEKPPAGQPGVEAGELYFIDNSVDKLTGTVMLGARFANADERLWPGQPVPTVLLKLGAQKNAVVVPTRAVQVGRDGKFVMVVKADKTIEVRPVQSTRADEQWTVIDRGLEPGTQVVTDGHFRLTVGSKVEIKSDAPTTQSAGPATAKPAGGEGGA